MDRQGKRMPQRSAGPRWVQPWALVVVVAGISMAPVSIRAAEPVPPVSADDVVVSAPMETAALRVPPGKASPEDSSLLATVVVTATRREEELLNAPVSISVIDSERIESRPAESLADLLREVPGVFVIDNTVSGLQRLRIRGEDARRGLVLIDGQEISDHSSFGPSLMIDPSFIDRIEVVRGPQSTLYGSRAAAGVVQIFTKKAPVRTLEGGASGAYTSASDGYRANSTIALKHKGAWLRISGGGTDNGDRHTPSGRLDDTANEAEAVMVQAGWSGDAHDLRFLYDRYDVESEAQTPDDLVDGTRITKFHMDLPRRDRERFAAFYDGWDLVRGLERLHVDVFRQSIDRRITQDIAGLVLPPTVPPTLYDNFSDDFDTIDTTGVNFQADAAPWRGHKAVFGGMWLNDDLDKTVLSSGTQTQGAVVTPIDATLRTKSSIATTALYLQDTYSFLERWQLTAGVRWYYVDSELSRSNDPGLPPNSSDDNHVVGSVALLWRPLDALSLRASWGQGYVYPTLLQLHTGSLFGQGGITRPNPALDPETSNNYELGARWQNAHLAVDAAVFYNAADDYIASVSAADAPETGWSAPDRTYTNLRGAETLGAEIFASLNIPDTFFETYGTLNWLQRELEFATFTTTDAGIPELSGRIGLRYRRPAGERWRWSVDVWLVAGGKSVEKTSRSTTTTSAWATANVGLGLEVGRAWCGIELINLGDERYRPSTDELVQPGRHVTVGVRMEL